MYFLTPTLLITLVDNYPFIKYKLYYLFNIIKLCVIKQFMSHAFVTADRFKLCLTLLPCI